MMTTRIVGTGAYVPEQIATNDDLARIVETNDEWIRSRTGIGERRIATTETNSYMAAQAAKQALDQAGIAPEDVDLILLATSSPDYCFPNGACEIQEQIGAVNAAGYDISAACTGFVFALNTAHAFIQAGIYRTALVVGADVLTCGSRTNGNFLLGKKPELGYMTMDGQEVFKFAVKKVPEIIKELLEENRTSLEEIRYFVLHQANYRIIESVAKRLKADISKFPANMERYGNTSGGSIPLLLDEMNRKGMLAPGDKIVLSGFGAGLTWGATLVEW